MTARNSSQVRFVAQRVAVALLLSTALTCGATPGAAAPGATDSAPPVGAPLARAPLADPLLSGFRNPPNTTRPQVWWHWMSGNVSLEGAKLDLAWMKRVGVGGVHTFAGGGLEPHVVQPPVDFMSAEWQRAFRETTHIARDSGMDVTIAGSPGWSETGGPWVEPRDAMKKYVWSEAQVDGGKPFRGLLPRPPSTSGPFLAVAASRRGAPPVELTDVYEDAEVTAFLTPPADKEVGSFKLNSSAGPIDLAPLQANDLANSVALPLATGRDSAWLDVSYDKTTTLSALTLGVREAAGVEIQASGDGQQFHTVMRAAADPAESPSPQQTYAFAATSARVFRVILTTVPPKPPLPGMPAAFIRHRAPTEAFSIIRFGFHGAARVNRFESKAGFQSTVDAQAAATAAAAPSAVIPRNGVIDLTSKLQSDGRLDWTPPPGRWTVIRLGWSLTGQTNGPAEPKDTGLEVDKLDPSKVRGYLEHYLSLYRDAMGADLGPQNVQSLLTDSWEAGVQNWTPTLLAQFKERRGYDPAPYLPVLAGWVVESASTSEAFLWDFHRTLEELLADNHYGVLAQVLHQHGMRYYTEAEGDSPRSIGDGYTIKSRSDIPTAELWYRPFATGPGQPSLVADLKEAASVGHVYGKPLVACESLTVAAGDDPWSFSPAMLKPVADRIFSLGVNRILMHESHHQPFIDRAPGLEMAFFGQYFNRNDTWAEEAGAWVDYLSRTSYLLQQGRYQADIAYFYGEERNLTERNLTRFRDDVPRGYAYDFVNAEALSTSLSVRDGRLVTPSGMSYRVLYMPDDVTRLTLPTLRRLRDLVSAGAILVGHKPEASLGVASSDADVQGLAQELWGSDASPNGRPYGRGRVYGGADLAAALMAEHVEPDARVEGGAADDAFPIVHRTQDDADIYFISNQQAAARDIEVALRVQGKLPELWHAEDGRVDPLSYEMTDHGIRVALHMQPNEADFIVLRGQPERTKAVVAASVSQVVATIDGRWTVTFQSGRGAPPRVVLDQLQDLSTSSDPGIRYFSGEATYSKTLSLPARRAGSKAKRLLDLGTVHEVAVVSIDGKTVETVWHPPYQVELPVLAAGPHRLAIKVANLWVNRLIGDKQPGAEAVAFAPQSPYRADSVLLPSGLIGPVRILTRDAP